MTNQVNVWVKVINTKGQFVGKYDSFNDAISELSEAIGENLSAGDFKDCYITEEI